MRWLSVSIKILECQIQSENAQKIYKNFISIFTSTIGVNGNGYILDKMIPISLLDKLSKLPSFKNVT